MNPLHHSSADRRASRLMRRGLIALACLTVLAPDADAYNTHGRWRKSEVPVPFTVNPANMPFGVDAITEAASKWSTKPDRIGFAWKFAGERSGTKRRDSNNVYMDDGRMGHGTLGITWWQTRGGYISSFDIGLNGRKRLTRAHYMNVITHEFGHALGLRHSRNPRAVMDSSGGPHQTVNNLHEDDIRGAASLYPPRDDIDRSHLAGGALATPSIVSPRGAVEARRPELRWTAVEGADSYELAIDRRGAGGDYQKAVRIKGLKDRSATLESDLGRGDYVMWVRAVRDGKPGEWSTASRFEVKVTLPGVVTLRSPIDSVDAVSPGFTWEAGDDSESYELRLADAEGRIVFSDDAIEGTSFDAPQALERGQRYRWWLRAQNDAGVGAWASAEFLVEESLVEAPVLVAPSGLITERSPDFRWQLVDDRATYDLRVEREGDGAVVISVDGVGASCLPGADGAEGECAGLFTATSPLEDGRYRVTLRTRSIDDSGAAPQLSAWSEAMSFQLGELAVAKPSFTSPSARCDRTRPELSWTEVAGATRYEIWLRQLDGGAQLAHDDQLSAARYSLSEALIPGKTYHAWVRAFVGETAGDWGTHAFIVDERACPDGICVESDDDDDGIDTPVTVARPGNVARPTTTGTRNPSCNGRPSCNGTPNRNCNRNRGRSGLFGRWRRSREASSVGLLGVMRRRR